MVELEKGLSNFCIFCWLLIPWGSLEKLTGDSPQFSRINNLNYKYKVICNLLLPVKEIDTKYNG